MATNENIKDITITAETIEQLLMLREVARNAYEADQSEVKAAIVRTLEQTMRMVGIKWEEPKPEKVEEPKTENTENTEEPQAEDKATGLTYKVHYIGSKSGKGASFTFRTDRSFRIYKRYDCGGGIGLGKPFENDMLAAAQRIMARPDSKMNVHGFNYMRIRSIECMETGETKYFSM